MQHAILADDQDIPGAHYYKAVLPADVNAKGAVLVIYTGGTIGSLPVDLADPDSPQVVVPWDEYVRRTPQFAPGQPAFIGCRVDAYAFDKPLDSCNVGPGEWVMMASIIEKHHDEYDGFVILHGTDSMIYSASALSFMLINLKKPVILTGAQIAYLFNSRNDGAQNMVTAIGFANPKLSGVPLVPEVCIYFNHKLLRGNRARKQDASGFDAYYTPNFPPLGEAGNRLFVDERLVLKPNDQAFQVVRRLQPNVLTFDVYPGIQNTELARNILNTKGIAGIVLRAFGSGNIPTKPEFLKVFRDAHAKEIVVQNVTQCLHGFVELGMYETSAELLEVGMVTGFDITPEAALCKLMVLLADEDLSFEERAQKAQRSVAGEMSRSLYVQALKQQKALEVRDDSDPVRLAPDRPIEGNWRGDKVFNASLRLYGGRITLLEDSPHIGIEVYLNTKSGDDLKRNSPNFAGYFRRRVTSVEADKEMIVGLDITNAARQLLNGGDRVSATVRIVEGKGILSWKDSELAVFINERI
ncbi:MAG: asparaginase [Alphaproteobacteria bacterium]|nr:asparaginase [Alphaproteobacteria bacterium]